MKIQTLAAALALLTVVMAGCSGPGPTKEPFTGTTIKIGDMFFEPDNVTVPAGTQVKWVHEGNLQHDVTAWDDSWQSEGGEGGMTNGDEFVRTFTEAGIHQYYCKLHGKTNMAGTVVVT